MLFAITIFSLSLTSCSVQRKSLHHVKLLFIYANHQVQICGQLIVEFKFYEIHRRKCVFIFNTTKNHPNCHLHQFHIFKQSKRNNGIKNHLSPHLIYNIYRLQWMQCTMYVHLYNKEVCSSCNDGSNKGPTIVLNVTFFFW